MMVFIDFEASSLSSSSYPIEVGWAFENGPSHACLIQRQPDWLDWSDSAQRLHGISRETLAQDGVSAGVVAARMVRMLGGHDLRSGAPGWDNKWLDSLLSEAGLSGHLTIGDSHLAHVALARHILADVLPEAQLDEAACDLIALVKIRNRNPVHAHRALADAREERRTWQAVEQAAMTMARSLMANHAAQRKVDAGRVHAMQAERAGRTGRAG